MAVSDVRRSRFDPTSRASPGLRPQASNSLKLVVVLALVILPVILMLVRMNVNMSTSMSTSTAASMEYDYGAGV